MTPQQTFMLKILDEVKDGYTVNTLSRNPDTGNCYYAKDNKCCAIGQYLSKDVAKQLDDLDGPGGTGVSNAYVWNVIKDNETIKQAPRQFWTDLQHLHDSAGNWDDTGLSDIGLSAYNSIKQRITFNLYKDTD